MAEKNTYSVAQVNAYIKNMFAQDFMLGAISVKGELSNVKYHSSGHIYFTLKEAGSAMRCVMFAGSRRGLGCKLVEGLAVVVSGSIEVYERDGSYQLYAKQIKQDGVGALYERFLAMKQSMEEMGMFDATYKQEIPKFVRRLGVVTAPTGAAVRDIISVSKRRNPAIEIILYPAIVQGDGAVASIVNGISLLDECGVDVIIVGRGGGSLEDLWAFNEEEVAQAIFDCRTPIISAVGHETDTTISDFVADLRAPTPSAAAELAVYDMQSILNYVDELRNRLNWSMKQKISKNHAKLELLQSKMDRHNPQRRVREQRMRLMQLDERFQNEMEKKLTTTQHRLAILVERYKAASPLSKLGMGYGHIAKKGKPVRSIQEIQKGDTLNMTLEDGVFTAVVDKVGV